MAETGLWHTNIGQTLRVKRLAHVAFAADVTLVSRSKDSLRRMLATLRNALASRGLTLHPTECKMQKNSREPHACGGTCVEKGFSVEVLPPGANLVMLGTVLHLDGLIENQIANQIASEWKLLWSVEQILLNRSVSIVRRLRLFSATVSRFPVV